MKNYLVCLITFIGLLLFSNFHVVASHIVGGELAYSWQGGNTYQFKLTFYRDCASVPAPNTVEINIASVSCGIIGTKVTLDPTPTSPRKIAYTCPLVSTCDGGTFVGFEKWEYIGTTVLTSNCRDYEFSCEICCRSASLTNIYDPANSVVKFVSTLNNFDVANNSSPTFAGWAIAFLSVGGMQEFNNGTYDSDLDSLVFSLSPANTDSGIVLYNSPFTYSEPISSNGSIVLNPRIGDFWIAPNTNELDAVVYQVEEYRNGILVGTISREIQALVSLPTNQVPDISGIDGTSNSSVSVCAGDTLSFLLYTSDPNSADNTFITYWDFPIDTALSLTTIFGPHQAARIEFITDTTMINSQPYNLLVTVSDWKCPFAGVTDKTYQIYVTNCNSPVWPGDANSDLKCNIYDVFPIGVAFGSTGPVRIAPTINWVPEAASEWPQYHLTGANYKHADCNGDGIVDFRDTVAIATNFGLSHPVRLTNPNLTQSSSVMYLTANQDSVAPGDSLLIDIMLGSSSSPTDSIYGIAFALNFNPILIDANLSTLTFIESDLGNPAMDLITFNTPVSSTGKVYGAAVRTNHINIISDTTIASFYVKIKNIPVNTIIPFSLNEIRGITADGQFKTFQSVSDSIFVGTLLTKTSARIEQINIDLAPNPAQNELFVISDNKSDGEIIIHDMSGKIVMEKNLESLNSKIDISQLTNGMYFVSIKNEIGLVWKKLIVFR